MSVCNKRWLTDDALANLQIHESTNLRTMSIVWRKAWRNPALEGNRVRTLLAIPSIAAGDCARTLGTGGPVAGAARDAGQRARGVGVRMTDE